MTTSITDDTSLRAEYFEVKGEYDRLLDSPELAGGAVGLHDAAWTAVKRDLEQQVPSITEDKLNSTSALEHPAHLWIMHRLYHLSAFTFGIEGDKTKSRSYYSRYQDAMRHGRWDTGSTTAASGSQTLMVRR
jgi:hypothetical protein